MVACCVGGFVSVTFKSIMCILYVEGLLGWCAVIGQVSLYVQFLCHPVLCVCVWEDEYSRLYHSRSGDC